MKRFKKDLKNKLNIILTQMDSLIKEMIRYREKRLAYDEKISEKMDYWKKKMECWEERMENREKGMNESLEQTKIMEKDIITIKKTVKKTRTDK